LIDLTHSEVAMSKSVMVQAVYRPNKGKEEALFALVKKHWPVLKKAGLVTGDVQVFRASNKQSKEVYFIEVFSWIDEKASGTAHQMPEVMSIWEPMGPLIQGGRGPELSFLEPVSIER
jgi:hypothetical protein